MSPGLTIPVTLLLALAVTAAPTARAADQTILGNQLVVKNPSTPDKRKVIAKAKEIGSLDTIVGDPTAAGATCTIAANGGTPSTQTFALPMGTSALTGKPFWSGDAVKGFKYKDSKGENGPIKVAQMKKSGSGVFQLKAVAVGKVQALSVLPPNPGTDGCLRLEIGGGDTYSVRFGADGQVTNDGAKQFKVVKPQVEGTCLPPTTTTTTTTTTTLFPSCTNLGDPCGTSCGGNGICYPVCNGGCDLACVNSAVVGPGCACTSPPCCSGSTPVCVPGLSGCVGGICGGDAICRAFCP